MKVKNPSTGNFEEVYVKALDSLPVGSEIDFTGNASDIPAGWEQSSGSQDMARATNIDNLTEAGDYSIFRATGTLPAGYSQDDATFMLNVKTSSQGKIQTLYPVGTPEIYERYMTQYGWSEWVVVTDIYSTDEQIIGTWKDGKPIYRKVYTTYTITTGTPVDTIILDSAFNNKNIVNSYGKIQVKSGTNVWDVTIGSPDVGFGIISTVNHALHSGILFFNRTTNAYGYLQSVNIIVEYTKTTD